MRVMSVGCKLKPVMMCEVVLETQEQQACDFEKLMCGGCELVVCGGFVVTQEQ